MSTFGSWMIWAFLATVLMTTVGAGSQAARLTRMSLPYLLGTLFTPSRDRARILGIGVHLLLGQIFGLLYLFIFRTLGDCGLMAGALIGLLHAAFVLLVAVPALPAIHPRMASEEQGPTATRQLESPGPLGLHYGLGTPVTLLFSHLVFGALLGALYARGVGR